MNKINKKRTIDSDEKVLLYNTGTGLKSIDNYIHNLDVNIPVINSVEDILVNNLSQRFKVT